MAATAPATTAALPDQPRRSLPHNLTASPLTHSQLQVLGDSDFADNALLAFICPPLPGGGGLRAPQSLMLRQQPAFGLPELTLPSCSVNSLGTKQQQHRGERFGRRGGGGREKGGETRWACGLPPRRTSSCFVPSPVSVAWGGHWGQEVGRRWTPPSCLLTLSLQPNLWGMGG